MAGITIGEPAPLVTGLDQEGRTFDLSAYRDRSAVVFFFYPADDTPICTKEVCSFRDAYEDFIDAGAVVIGVSGDDQASHHRFAAAHKLPFVLLADGDGSIRRAFGVPRSFGVFPGRVTYVIDKRGIVRHVFNSQFAAEQHVRESLDVIHRLKAVPDAG